VTVKKTSLYRLLGKTKWITKSAMLVTAVLLVVLVASGAMLASARPYVLPQPFFRMSALPNITSVDLSDLIGTRNAPRRAAAMGLEITGLIPEAHFDNEELNEKLEERFAAQVNSFIQAHQASALSINFSTDVFSHHAYFGQNADEDEGEYYHLLVSIVITMEAVSAATTTAIATTVVNTYYGEIITLSQYNINAIALVNNYIRTRIDANPRLFVPNFSGIDAEHPFYFNNGRLVIPFASGELTIRGSHRVTLATDNIDTVIVRPTQTYTLPAEQYSVRMVRLAVVAVHFGYELDWDARTRTAQMRMGDEVISTLIIGENAYSYRNMEERTLEVAPALRLNRTYVPLSFFDEIMGLTATVTSNGYIVISRYVATINFDDEMDVHYENYAR